MIDPEQKFIFPIDAGIEEIISLQCTNCPIQDLGSEEEIVRATKATLFLCHNGLAWLEKAANLYGIESLGTAAVAKCATNNIENEPYSHGCMGMDNFECDVDLV